MKQLLLFSYIFFLCQLSFAQSPSESANNIISNPSFERFSAPPIGWFKKGEHYTRVMKFWQSATTASPDVFGPRVRVPNYWLEKGFGTQPPHTGMAMSGLTIYGCEGKKTHCREYIEIQLNAPLVLGQTYYCEMYVSHLNGSFISNNLGMYFSEEKIDLSDDEIIEAKAQVEVKEILDIPNNKWQKISAEFVAKTEAEFMTIGNFNTDENTDFKSAESDNIPYAYYYIDDVLVKKLPPYLPVPVKEDDLTLVDLEEGETIELKHIYFDFNSWDLHPRSFIELEKLKRIMDENEDMVIEIIGHTDSIGEDRYNKYLSRKRAKSVVLYLLDHLIPAKRLLYKGLGEDIPVASNETDSGRQLNRRVEFRIVKK